jgi:hypothetical protein
MAKKVLKKAQVGVTVTAADRIKAGQKAGWKPDQAGAAKAGLTDTSDVSYMSKRKFPIIGKKEFAGVKKDVKKTGGAIKTKKK